jgi:hypothetical protein
MEKTWQGRTLLLILSSASETKKCFPTLEPDMAPPLTLFAGLWREFPGGRAARFVQALVVLVIVQDGPVCAVF